MFSPRSPYQVQTADMFPPTNNKKASLCTNLQPQTHKHHWQALLRHHQPLSLSRDLLRFQRFFRETENFGSWIRFHTFSGSFYLVEERDFVFCFFSPPQHLENDPCKVPESPAGNRTELRDLCSGRIGFRCAELGGYFFREGGPFLGDWFWLLSTLGADFRKRCGISGSGEDRAEQEKRRKAFWILSPPTRKHLMLLPATPLRFSSELSSNWDSVFLHPECA